MTLASFIVALLAIVFSVGSAWWLYGLRGRLVASKPPHYALLSESSLLFFRLGLAVRNTGGRTLVAHDMRCWFPDTQQAISIPWRRTVFGLQPDQSEPDHDPSPFAVKGHDAVAMLVEFGCPLPGVVLDEGNHAVRIEILTTDDLKWSLLAEFEIKISRPGPTGVNLSTYGIYRNLDNDEYAQERLVKATGPLLERMKRIQQELADPN